MVRIESWFACKQDPIGMLSIVFYERSTLYSILKSISNGELLHLQSRIGWSRHGMCCVVTVFSSRSPEQRLALWSLIFGPWTNDRKKLSTKKHIYRRENHCLVIKQPSEKLVMERIDNKHLKESHNREKCLYSCLSEVRRHYWRFVHGRIQPRILHYLETKRTSWLTRKELKR